MALVQQAFCDPRALYEHSPQSFTGNNPVEKEKEQSNIGQANLFANMNLLLTRRQWNPSAQSPPQQALHPHAGFPSWAGKKGRADKEELFWALSRKEGRVILTYIKIKNHFASAKHESIITSVNGRKISALVSWADRWGHLIHT